MGRRLIVFWDTPLLLRRALEHPLTPEESQVPMRTGILNVLELVHLLLKRGERAAANAAYEKYEPVVEGLSRKRIFESSRIRVQHSDRGLSYADAAGYATAREIGALFMTTDRGFAGLPGVRIVPG